ncbi:LamB/YcsF family protein [Salinicoccus halitifaciens]|uniref:UPF0271 protein n=1 Tax=Salinicoccus halitifaciens TaxID=1073415 RepID=A0ABV2EC31_9STAP|nr:5-oxoprolinase subunit PxpA [Salinicoccus halitifaciens]MCD2137364.1 LamB/YcsF family protein [Salinicoccus halitifaciens]
MKIDLNCDMGESFGLHVQGNDEEMMKYITSANIACGFHSGDPHVMRETVALAKKYGVGIGAHPGLPDLVGFGRRRMDCTASEMKDFVTYQMGALREFSRANGVSIQHCKPHGAMYMQAMEDHEVARAILEAIEEIDKNTIVFAVNNSAMLDEAVKMGIPVAKEGYADREHTADGSLVLTRKSRNLDDFDKMAERVVRLVKEKKVITHDGEDASLEVETICIHGDNPDAPKLAKSVVSALENAGVEIVPVKQLI